MAAHRRSPTPTPPGHLDPAAAQLMTARLAGMRPAELDDEQRELYEAITSGPRSRGQQAFRLVDDDGELEGPFNAMLLSPGVGAALQSLGARLRYGSAMTDRTREIVILVVAHHWDSAFEVYAHEAVGALSGLVDHELMALRDGRWTALTEPVERLAAETAAALVRDGDLDDALYAAAAGAVGARTLFEITTIVGYYATLALQLRVYRVTPPVP